MDQISLDISMDFNLQCYKNFSDAEDFIFNLSFIVQLADKTDRTPSIIDVKVTKLFDKQSSAKNKFPFSVTQNSTSLWPRLSYIFQSLVRVSLKNGSN